jgi:hypothetical protein
MKRFKTKRVVALAATGALLLGIGGVAFAYFTSDGSGSGAAKTGTGTAVQISQIGAGYDSLVPTSVYHQDQTYAGAFTTEFGNDITLANAGDQQLVNVVVAMDNWGPAITNLPITFTINNTVAGPISDTQDFSFAPAINGGTPSETNITFDFSSQNAFVQQEFVYGISFAATGSASGLNVALSNSANDLSVGTDTVPGTVWIDTTAGPGIANDFPACSTPASGVFASVSSDCGPFSLLNPGAYGTAAQVAAGSDDIPAVEVNVVGGIVPTLTPGGPAQPVDFAITNNGSASVHVDDVTTALGTVPPGTGTPKCSASDYALNNPGAGVGVVGVNENVAPGTTLFDPSGLTLSMIENNANQDACEGAVIPLNFTSN